jgi:hypothetical protein
MPPPQLDVGKLVGAASAPVALIIATSIFLGNLGGKYAGMMAVFRDLSAQYRNTKDRSALRCRSIERQLALYSSRLRGLVRATFWLNLSIQAFMATVLFTSLGVIFPKSPIWTWVTGIFGLIGLLLLGYSGVLEMLENRRAQEELSLEVADLSISPAEETSISGAAAGRLDGSGR